MKIHKNLCAVALAVTLTAGILFSGCGFRPDDAVPGKETVAAPEAVSVETVAVPTETPKANVPTFTVTYMDGDTVLATETVAEGACPVSAAVMGSDGSAIIGWTRGSDKTVLDVSKVQVYSDITFTAVAGPELIRDKAFIAAETDGLFHPDREFTRSDASRAVYALLKVKPQGETFLNDVTTRARCYQAATTLVTAGWMTLDGGRFRPDTAITMSELKSLLGNLFAASAIETAAAELSDTITRAEAAELFYMLLGQPSMAESAYYPDVTSTDSYYAAVSAVGMTSGYNWGDTGRAAPGFIHLEGYLYNVEEDGYFLKDGYVGSLYFDSTGRFTSGNYELDGYVADILAEIINNDMTQEQQLRIVYDHVRDKYLYLKRNLYEVGELGWEIDEALKMYTTGKGNCYNFTAAFWSLTRGIGYESVCLSGLVGVGRDPHSWVEIPIDGILYIFDPETEMSYMLQEAYWADLYMLTYEEGEYWSYAREPYPEDEPTETAG